MLNLAPWYFRDFLQTSENEVFESISSYETILINGEKKWEAASKLKNKLLPEWVATSLIYSDKEGSGTDSYKNIAIHKAISEGLERWAFYSAIEEFPNEYGFNYNPSTTGIAAFPEVFVDKSRKNAIFEATERWCVHEFWRSNLPVVEHQTNIRNLKHFEIVSGLKNVSVSLLYFKYNNFNIFGFACDRDLKSSFNHALVELSRNVFVFKNLKSTVVMKTLSEVYDKRIYFFSTDEGLQLFNDKVAQAPRSILKSPKIICDTEIKGPWSKYSKVWRYLYENTQPEDDTDHTFFMF